MNIADTIDGARRAFEIAGCGCLIRLGEDEPRYATVAEPALPPQETSHIPSSVYIAKVRGEMSSSSQRDRDEKAATGV